jgi:hypothetical protein
LRFGPDLARDCIIAANGLADGAFSMPRSATLFVNAIKSGKVESAYYLSI